MKAILCLVLVFYFCNATSGCFDNLPPSIENIGVTGYWLHDLSEDEAEKVFRKSLNGISDTVIREEDINSFKLCDGDKYYYGSFFFVFGAVQDSEGKRAGCIPPCKGFKVLVPPSMRPYDREFICNDNNGVYQCNIGSVEIGVNTLMMPVVDSVYSYSYVLVLASQAEKVKFAVFDLDDTAFFTAKRSVEDMVLNCRTAPVNKLIKDAANFFYTQGHIIVYISRRDFTLHSLTRWQLRKSGFPEGLIFLDLNGVLDTSGDVRPRSASTHKDTTLAWLRNYGELCVGFGDKPTDTSVYTTAEVKVIFELCHDGATYYQKTEGREVRKYTLKRQFPGYKEIEINLEEDLCKWRSIYPLMLDGVRK